MLYSPTNCAKHGYKIRTVKDIFKLPSKTLGEFKREFGKDWVVAYVEMWLIELNDSANIKNKMNPAQMEFTAERIYESYSLKVTDLTLFFRNIKEGVYGPYYENLSQDKIMAWLKEYYDLRCEYAAMYAGSEHEKFSATKDKMNTEVMQKMFEGVGENKEENIRSLYTDSSTIGKRLKKQLDKEIDGKMTEALAIILHHSIDELKEYLIKNDSSSEDYNEKVYALVEQELDRRQL